MPHEPGRLREAPEVVGADIVLVDFGLALARGTGLDGSNLNAVESDRP
jgi:hypothetical protein